MSKQPIPGRCGAKKRKTKPPDYCEQHPLKGRKRCKIHGGKSPRGLESPRWTGGWYRAHSELLTGYKEAAQNTEWLSLREEILLTKGQIQAHLQQMKKGQISTPLLRELLKMVGRLSEQHAKMAKDLHQMVSLERVLRLVNDLGALVREHVKDPKALRAIQHGLAATAAQPGKEDE